MKWLLLWPAISILQLIAVEDSSENSTRTFVGILLWPFLVPVIAYIAARGALKYLVELHKEFLK